ncbi:MAG: Gfo/Idh/MocA family oxidoreductase [Planctomycetes bacterium]|nr:Gfo/Idh/MocA family oxidoreductase [Planctomycetota bacterium]
MTRRGEVRVAMIGTRFMGKAHSNAWTQVAHFHGRPLKPVLQVLCGRDRAHAETLAERWGWQHVETDWRRVLERDDVDVVDICTPNNLHAEPAIAALKAGKHVLCEKPLARNVKECLPMVRAAAAAKGQLNFVCFNYRRVPALALARKLVLEERLGRIYHVRCVYLNSGAMNPDAPLRWRMQADLAGSGPNGDLNAHIVDAARFVSGLEIAEVAAAAETFIKERPIAGQPGRKGKVTVEDAILMLARFSNGALGSFEASRFGRGWRNKNAIEINGEKGALRFEFEDMNRLKYFDATAPNRLQGWTDILVTEPDHPYAGAYWPPGHVIGYEHTFINICADVLEALGQGPRAIAALQPNFADACQVQRVLDAALKAARSRRWERTGC